MKKFTAYLKALATPPINVSNLAFDSAIYFVVFEKIFQSPSSYTNQPKCTSQIVRIKHKVIRVFYLLKNYQWIWQNLNRISRIRRKYEWQAYKITVESKWPSHTVHVFDVPFQCTSKLIITFLMANRKPASWWWLKWCTIELPRTFPLSVTLVDIITLF